MLGRKQVWNCYPMTVGTLKKLYAIVSLLCSLIYESCADSGDGDVNPVSSCCPRLSCAYSYIKAFIVSSIGPEPNQYSYDHNSTNHYSNVTKSAPHALTA